MFDPFERVARAHHICPCCERPFSAEEEDEFVKKVENLHWIIAFFSCMILSIFAIIFLGKNLLSWHVILAKLSCYLDAEQS